MGKRLYVGNLPYGMTDEELAKAFEGAGQVADVTIVIDRETGRSRGFGFVEMSTEDESAAALAQMNGAEVGGRTLKVAEAKERPTRSGGMGDRGGSRPRDTYRRDDY